MRTEASALVFFSVNSQTTLRLTLNTRGYNEGVPHHTTLVNNQPHPIEITLAIILAAVDSLLWLINESLGLHKSNTAAPTTATVTINKDYILSLTVKQLRALTGIKSSRYNKAALQQEALLLNS